MIIKGFKFGTLLQLAIGPVSLFVFDLANRSGFLQAEVCGIGVAVADALFILLAIFGIASLLKNNKIKTFFKGLGAVILGAFGTIMILGVFNINVFIGMSTGVLTPNSISSAFVSGIIITAANPLTILFWAGVFAAKILEEKMLKRDLYLFGLGAVIPTFISQTLFALLGTLTKKFLPQEAVNILNLLVGISLIYFALRLLLKKDDSLRTNEVK